MSTDNNDSSSANTPPATLDQAIELLRSERRERRRFERQCERLTELNEDLRQQVIDLSKRLSDASRLANKPTTTFDQESTTTTAIADENPDPTNAFQWDAGLGVYVNSKLGLMYDGELYFYYDRTRQKHLYYSVESGQYEELDWKRRSSKKEELDDGANTTCCRLVVVTSDCEELLGALFVVPSVDGRRAIVGRLAEADVPIADRSIGERQAAIEFEEEENRFFLYDLSENASTLINGAAPTSTSQKAPLDHLDTIQLGASLTISCHLHTGRDEQCADCQPALVRAKLLQQADSTTPACSEPTNRRAILKSIKRKYGLEREHFEQSTAVPLPSNAVDRARERRLTVGSDAPGTEAKSTSASLGEPIPADNKGREMLARIGWQGGALGLEGGDNGGLVEPLEVRMRTVESAGLGYLDSVAAEYATERRRRLDKARQRYDEAMMSNGEAKKDDAVQSWVSAGFMIGSG